VDGFKGSNVLSVEDATQDDGIPFEKVDTALKKASGMPTKMRTIH